MDETNLLNYSTETFEKIKLNMKRGNQLTSPLSPPSLPGSLDPPTSSGRLPASEEVFLGWTSVICLESSRTLLTSNGSGTPSWTGPRSSRRADRAASLLPCLLARLPVLCSSPSWAIVSLSLSSFP